LYSEKVMLTTPLNVLPPSSVATLENSINGGGTLLHPIPAIASLLKYRRSAHGLESANLQ